MASLAAKKCVPCEGGVFDERSELWYHRAMTKVLKEEQMIKIGREAMVLLPLKKWEEIRELLENLEDTARFQVAFKESRGKKKVGLGALRKKYNL